MSRILVGCEFSGVVREAFRKRGHDAWSCDFLPTELPGNHIRGDIRNEIAGKWDALIAFPPCTYLCNSGVRWLYVNGAIDTERWIKMKAAARFFRRLLESDINYICLENPIQHRHARQIVGKNYSQIIHPWQFGHEETKATCLWLKNLPPLNPTGIVGPPPKDRAARKSWERVHRATPHPDRWKERSRTLAGIAEAMADQWGRVIK